MKLDPVVFHALEKYISFIIINELSFVFWVFLFYDKMFSNKTIKKVIDIINGVL